MMTATIKKMTTALILISSISFLSVLQADEVIVPVMNKPAILQEGTQRDLTAIQIAELLPWAKNSKSMLIDLVESTQALSTDDKIERMYEGIKSVVGESAPKNSELLMRYTLNRSLVLISILDKEMDSSAVGALDVKVRVLKLSIAMALKFYDADVASLTSDKALPFAAFGVDYFTFLSELNKSIFDASAQYQVQRISLEWLQWDLYRDLNNPSYASQIVKINNSLKIFPEKATTDAKSINYIKQMKEVTKQLNLIVVKIPQNTDRTQATVEETFSYDYSQGYAANSNGYCYAVDKSTGRLLTSTTVSDSKCIGSYAADTNGYCYGVDKATKRLLTSTTVSDSKCNDGKYAARSNGYCYAVDKETDRLLTSTTVSDSKCNDGKYAAHSNGYCYAVDKETNRLLTSTTVSDSKCSNGRYAIHSNGYCYAVDETTGRLLTSSTVSNSKCSSN